MPQFKDLTGLKFGKWFVITRAEDHVSKGGFKFTQWLCQCDCGKQQNVFANALLSGRSTSCGCAQHDHSKETCRKNFTTHGESKTRLYKIWASIKKRCTNPNATNYSDYGGRGISMCDSWASDYCCFAKWAHSNGYADNLSIERIDVNGDYDPSNCTWADTITQANNRRSSVRLSCQGKNMTIAEWSRELGITYKQLHKKLSAGKSLEEIINKI